ncbi:MAG: hypothetical protein Q4E05_00955 [Pseudoclavibacter sp.]|nr:hypothetical protein [Pseudoclavibacter sp.]
MPPVRTNPQWEKRLEELARSATKNVAADLQRGLDSILRRYAGQPASTIKPVLRREFSKFGGSIPDHELTTYAELISKGTRIELRA